MNLRRYLMVKQALMDQETFNHVNSQAGAGTPQRTWGEFFSIGGNRAAANRANAQQADAYTSYLKANGVGQGALSKEDFLKTHATPQLKRTWGEFLSSSPLSMMTGSKNSWIGGSGNSSLASRQAASDTNAYNKYLQEFSQKQQPNMQGQMPQQPMQ